jgi:hypothetical protein
MSRIFRERKFLNQSPNTLVHIAEDLENLFQKVLNPRPHYPTLENRVPVFATPNPLDEVVGGSCHDVGV